MHDTQSSATAMTEGSTPEGRQGAFDILKFVLSAFVVLIHAPWAEGTFADALLRTTFAIMAVPLYFCMAGFFLFQKLPEGPLRLRKDRLRVWRYAGRTLLLYVLWVALYLPLVRAVAQHTWFLGALAAGAAICGVLAMFLRREALFLLALAPFLFVPLAQPLVSVPLIGPFIDMAHRQYPAGLVTAMAALTLGALLAQYPPKKERPRRQIILMAAAGFALSFSQLLPFDIHVFSLVLLPSCFLILRAMQHARVPNSPRLTFLRRCGFLIYLLHPVVLQLLRLMDAPLWKIPFVLFLCSFGASFALAAGWLLLERQKAFRFLKILH